MKLKNKVSGFTLIELLAVIVILAVIALIATPIVLNIINNSKNDSTVRSGELYIDAVENAIAKAQLNGTEVSSGTYTINSDGNLSCTSGYQCSVPTIEVEASGTKPNSGTIIIEKGKVVSKLASNSNIQTNIAFDKKIVLYDENNKLVVLNNNETNTPSDFTNSTICVGVTNETKTTGNVPSGNYNLGDEYICSIDSKTKYHFFILSVEGTKINLILDRNLVYEKENVSVPWINQTDYNDDDNWQTNGSNNKGPITAMNTLYNVTKNWSNIPNTNGNYKDEGNTGEYGYDSLQTKGDITKIFNKNYSSVASYTNLKARMPRYSEVIATGCGYYNELGTCPLYMVNYLENSPYVTGGTNIEDVTGYWTLSSNEDYISGAKIVSYTGNAMFTIVKANYGIRPVISVSTSDLS